MQVAGDNELWHAPSPELVLGDNEVHLWRVCLDDLLADRATLAATLAIDEHERAARFAFEHLRQRFIISRGMLRAILARYLHSSPELLQFGHTAYGKPFLTYANDQTVSPANAALSPTNLTFNLSHSDTMALYAISNNRAVGVDIEHTGQLADYAAIAERYFAPAEYTALMALPQSLRHTAFYHCWTRKEAFIKANGLGLSMPLASFQVSVAPDETPRVVCVGGSYAEAQRWSLWSLLPAPAYVAALVAEGPDLAVRRFAVGPAAGGV